MARYHGVPDGDARWTRRAMRQLRRQRVAYNDCCIRHCPKCQGLARVEWLRIDSRAVAGAELSRRLHPASAVVRIAFQNKAAVYAILFRSAAEMLTHHRCRSRASGRANPHDRRAPHLGSDAAATPAHSLRRASGGARSTACAYRCCPGCRLFGGSERFSTGPSRLLGRKDGSARTHGRRCRRESRQWSIHQCDLARCRNAGLAAA